MKGKVAPTKSTTKAYVSFRFSLSAVVSPALHSFFIDSETNETTPLHFWNVFHFFKNLWEKLFSSNVCEGVLIKLQEKALILARNSHTFWLDISFFSHVKKHRSRFWLDVSFFSRVKTIVRSSDWLELICVREFTT